MENGNCDPRRTADRGGNGFAAPGRDIMGARLDLAMRTAKEAGRLAMEMRRCRTSGFVRTKGHQDFVGDADLAAESLIRKAISDCFPEKPILGEKDRLDCTDGNGCWVVDPIDGTTNYLRRLPDGAVPFAHCEGKNILCDVIHAPDSGETAWARHGGGCHFDGSPVCASACTAPSHALVLTGCSNRSSRDSYLAFLDAVMNDGMTYRQSGSAACSLIQFACGRAGAFYGAHLKPWDAMAGKLMVREPCGHVHFPDIESFLSCGGPVRARNSGMQARVESAVHGASG